MIDAEVQEPSTVVEETAAPAGDVPEAPDVSAQSAAGDEPAPTDAKPATTDRPRDEHGRFLKRDGTPVAPDEQAALTAAIPATPTTSPAPTQPSVPAGEPFVFRADGQKIPIPGSTLSADGALSIPADQVPVIRQLLAEGVAHRGSWRQKESEYQRRIEEASSVEKARADKYNHAAVFLFDKVNDPTWLQALVNDPERELGLLRRELGLELKQRDVAAPRVQEQPKAQEPDQAQVAQQFGSALTDEVDELLEDPRVRGLFTPEDIEDLKADYIARMAAYAERIDPQTGEPKPDGVLVVDRQAVKRAFDREVKTQQRIKQAAAEAAKAREFNEKRNAPAPAIAPVISTKGPGSTGSTTKKFQSRDEWRKSMGMS